MYRSLWCKSGVNLKRTATVIDGVSSYSSATAKYFLFTTQNSDIKSRVTSIYNSFYTTNTSKLTSSSDTSIVVSYLINSCGLSESKAITASKKLNFKTTSNPDSVLALLRTYGFTDTHISKLIPKYPAILSFRPDKTLKPKLDFFKSKGLNGLDLVDFISKDPKILMQSFNVPSFDILKSIVHSDQNIMKMITRNNCILNANLVKRLMVNLELLRKEGVPQSKISKYLVYQPRTFTGDVDNFEKIVEKVKKMGFISLQASYLRAIQTLASLSEVNWKKKEDVYRRWGWSEDHLQTAFRNNPYCMVASEKKIMAVMNFLVNEMGYKASSISHTPVVFTCSLKERIIPRCSVIRILLSTGLIKEKLCINSLSTMVDKSFVEKFVKKYEQEVPELMKVFKCQLNYQDLLQK